MFICIIYLYMYIYIYMYVRIYFLLYVYVYIVPFIGRPLWSAVGFSKHSCKARIEQTDRRAEWRGLKRMECLITAFGNPKKSPKVTNAEITACKKATHDTRYFILKFPPLAKLIPCTTPTLYPASGAYKRREFQPLPALAKGMESAQCAGVGVVSTTPRKGSPASLLY